MLYFLDIYLSLDADYPVSSFLPNRAFLQQPRPARLSLSSHGLICRAFSVPQFKIVRAPDLVFPQVDNIVRSGSVDYDDDAMDVW